MGGRRVRVFHISDLHMQSVDGPQAERARLEAASRWRVLGEKWTANLAELRRDGTPIDLVVLTGDLGDWGHPTDYPRSLAFLKQTCAALDVPIERLFVVPGNHDIDRTIQGAAWESLRRDVARDPHAGSRWMAGEDRSALRADDRRDHILERQRAFWTAVATELGRPELAPERSPHRRLGYRQVLTLPGLSQPIHVIGLDTAWLAGDDGDSGQLRLTEHQVSLLTTTEGGEPLPGFRLALMHHRLADLADGADARKLLADRVDLLLHGHQHEPTADARRVGRRGPRPRTAGQAASAQLGQGPPFEAPRPSGTNADRHGRCSQAVPSHYALGRLLCPPPDRDEPAAVAVPQSDD